MVMDVDNLQKQRRVVKDATNNILLGIAWLEVVTRTFIKTMDGYKLQ
jgi:hypothetical protein